MTKKNKKATKKNQEKRRTIPNPKYIISLDETLYLFTKHPVQKHHHTPLAPEWQAAYLPSECTIDEALAMDRLSEADIVKLPSNHRKKLKRLRKQTSKKKLRRASKTLCSAPGMLPDTRPAWFILLTGMLAMVMDLASRHLPGTPVIQRRNAAVPPASLQAIRKAVHGPSKLAEALEGMQEGRQPAPPEGQQRTVCHNHHIGRGPNTRHGAGGL